jgi:uncharacterized repeat protein (TIGR01451 family)
MKSTIIQSVPLCASSFSPWKRSRNLHQKINYLIVNKSAKYPNMKRILMLLLLFAGMANAQIVNIPDANLKTKLLQADATNNTAFDNAGNPIRIDTNNDGEIQQSEALTVYQLRLWNSTVFNMTGIGGFSNLTSLDCSGNILFNLDVSMLTNLTILNCNNNFLQTLNVSGLSNLGLLFCDNNRLTSISGLGDLVSLQRLFCNNNLLTSLDVTNSPNLIMFICQTNTLTNLNVSGLSNLTLLMCGGNNLASINLTGLTSLLTLECNNNELTSLNVSGLASLNSLNCFYNQLTALDLTQNTALTNLNCGENNIMTLNLNGLINLNTLECNYLPNNAVINGANLNALTLFQYTGSNSEMTFNGFPNLASLFLTVPQPALTLNFSGFSDAFNLYFGNNLMTSLTINGVGTTHIKSINCSNHGLSNLSLNGLSNLKELYCSNNQLTSVNLTNLPNLTQLDVSNNRILNLNLDNVTNLKQLNCANNQITSLNLSGLPALESLNCSNSFSVNPIGNQITSLDLSSLTQLKSLDCSNYNFNGQLGALGNHITSLDVNHLTHLEQLKCAKNNIPTLVVNGLVNLKELDCSLNLLTSLDLIGLTNLEILNYSYNSLSNLNMTGLVNITQLDCSYNSIATLTVVDMPNLNRLNCGHNLLTTLNVSGLAQLENLDCDSNLLTTLDVTTTPNLKSLSLNANTLSAIDLSNVPQLESLNCNNNLNITSLDLSNCLLLEGLYCANNQLNNLEISALTHLYFLQCDVNQLTTLNVGTLTELRQFSCSDNQISNLDTFYLPNLINLTCNNNLLTSLDLTTCRDIYGVYCQNNQITELDLSNCHRITDIWCNNNPPLNKVFMKNGSTESSINFADNPNLAYICADQGEVASVQQHLNTEGMTATVCNTYCSVTPGGPHNTVVGTTIFDGNNNGCNANDPLHPNIRVDISDGTTTGSAFTNSLGTCTFFTEAGDYTIAPNIENASAFNISPASANISFPNSFNNLSSQSFCLSANGTHPDVEVVFTPTGPARPGFDAHYKIVYKNKGNQTLSGAIAMLFDDDKLDLISAAPAQDSQTGGVLNWNYNNLLPFESRSIDVVLNVNSPLENPPVNNDDVLGFTVSITPATDDISSDNQFTLNQIVVGPFDPNDKTCLEGAAVTTELIGKYLHYAINFENLGNAAAENVVVKDVLDPLVFDVNSLQVLYASHDVQSTIRGNVVEFIFRNINLAPAVGDPPVGGHGTILFKIKTLPTLDNGSLAENTANIFFDYNAPVETNTARTLFATLSLPEVSADQSVKVYPNPTSDFINVSCDSAIQSVELFDIHGRLVQTALPSKKQTKVDISGNAKGIYLVRIKTAKGKRVEKIIKE